jgi:hypothetical protein
LASAISPETISGPGWIGRSLSIRAALTRRSANSMTAGPARRRRDPGAILRHRRLLVRSALSLKLGLAMAILLIS